MQQDFEPVAKAGLFPTLYFFVRDRFRIGRRARKRHAKVVLDQRIADPATPRLAIDCGANVGAVSARLLAAGYEVHAFEPDPAALAVLTDRLGGKPAITIIPAAVSHHAGRARLRRHRDFIEGGDLLRTESSSIVDRPKVDDAHAVDVEVVDLCSYLRGLGRPIGLLKMDIEGAEVGIVHRMLDEGLVCAIAFVSIETHERFGLGIAWRTAQARARVAQARLTNVSFDHP